MLIGGGVAIVHGCGPRKGSSTAHQVATTTAPTATATAPTATATTQPTATANPTGTIGIPGFGFGLPVSPRQALIGHWNVVNVDGKPVGAGGGSDPMDPATYIAGSGVVFTADTVTLTRSGSNFFSRPYKVVQEIPPVRVVIDAGYGPSNVDFALDGSCVWSLPSTPPHAVQLTRAQ